MHQFLCLVSILWRSLLDQTASKSKDCFFSCVLVGCYTLYTVVSKRRICTLHNSNAHLCRTEVSYIQTQSVYHNSAAVLLHLLATCKSQMRNNFSFNLHILWLCDDQVEAAFMTYSIANDSSKTERFPLLFFILALE